VENPVNQRFSLLREENSASTRSPALLSRKEALLEWGHISTQIRPVYSDIHREHN